MCQGRGANKSSRPLPSSSLLLFLFCMMDQGVELPLMDARAEFNTSQEEGGFSGCVSGPSLPSWWGGVQARGTVEAAFRIGTLFLPLWRVPVFPAVVSYQGKRSGVDHHLGQD